MRIFLVCLGVAALATHQAPDEQPGETAPESTSLEKLVGKGDIDHAICLNDGKTLAFVTSRTNPNQPGEKTVTLMDAATKRVLENKLAAPLGKRLSEMTDEKTRPFNWGISPDLKTAWVRSDKTKQATLYDLESGKEIHRWLPGYASYGWTPVKYSSDGSRLVLSQEEKNGKDTLRLWDRNTGKWQNLLDPLDTPVLAVSPKLDRMIVVNRKTQRSSVVDIATNKVLMSFQRPKEVRTITMFSDEGDEIYYFHRQGEDAEKAVLTRIHVSSKTAWTAVRPLKTPEYPYEVRIVPGGTLVMPYRTGERIEHNFLDPVSFNQVRSVNSSYPVLTCGQPPYAFGITRVPSPILWSTRLPQVTLDTTSLKDTKKIFEALDDENAGSAKKAYFAIQQKAFTDPGLIKKLSDEFATTAKMKIAEALKDTTVKQLISDQDAKSYKTRESSFNKLKTLLALQPPEQVKTMKAAFEDKLREKISPESRRRLEHLTLYSMRALENDGSVPGLLRRRYYVEALQRGFTDDWRRADWAIQ